MPSSNNQKRPGGFEKAAMVAKSTSMPANVMREIVEGKKETANGR